MRSTTRPMSGSSGSDWCMAVGFEPDSNLLGVEPYEAADLDVRDAPLVDETAKMADAVIEPAAQLLVVKELSRGGAGRSGDGAHGVLLRRSSLKLTCTGQAGGR